MNRLLLIPFVVVCAGFAAWCWLNPGGNASENALHANSVSNEPDKATKPFEGDFDLVTASLLSKWNDASPQSEQRMFSRGQMKGELPFDNLMTKTTFSNDQQVSNRLLVGSFTVTRRENAIEFPVIVDQTTGEASVYAARTWYDFDEWVVERQGVFR